MSKTDARITVNLPQEVYEPLKRTSDLLGVSMSSIIREFVETAVPMLAVLEDAALAIKTAPTKHREMLRALADEMSGVQLDAQAVMAKVLTLGDPRTSNTGVRNER